MSGAVAGGGGQEAKVHGSIFTLNPAPNAFIPYFSIRKLPAAFASFRGLPPSNILLNSDNLARQMGSVSQISWAAIYINIKFPLMLLRILAPSSIRGPPHPQI